MRKLVTLIIIATILASCGDGDENVTIDGPYDGYRLFADDNRLFASYVNTTVYFTIKNVDNNDNAPFERYVINAKGKEVRVYYKENDPLIAPQREYSANRINGTNDVLIKMECSTPLKNNDNDSVSVDILKFKSGRIDIIKTVYKYEVNSNITFGGSSINLKKAWYNGQLFYDDFMRIDSIVVDN